MLLCTKQYPIHTKDITLMLRGSMPLILKWKPSSKPLLQRTLLNYDHSWVSSAIMAISYKIYHPLNNLLCQYTSWKWSTECAEAFCLAKEKMHHLMCWYTDQSLPLRIAGDASAYRVGAVTAKDGQVCPIAFASWTLLPNEQKYSPILYTGVISL